MPRDWKITWQKKRKQLQINQGRKNVKIDPRQMEVRNLVLLSKTFLKDVSVEVPNSPEIFTQREAPQIAIELGNSGKPLLMVILKLL